MIITKVGFSDYNFRYGYCFIQCRYNDEVVPFSFVRLEYTGSYDGDRDEDDDFNEDEVYVPLEMDSCDIVAVGEIMNGSSDRFRRRNHRIPFDDVLWTYPNLGFVNDTLSTAYISKRPSRQYKKGCSEETTDLMQISSEEIHALSINHVIPDDLSNQCRFNSDSFQDSLWNRRYPTIVECIRSVLNTNVLSMAFDKDFCIAIKNIESANPILFYKTIGVGYVEDEDTVTLLNSTIKDVLFERLQPYFRRVDCES